MKEVLTLVMGLRRKLGQFDGEEVGDVLGVDFDLIAGLKDFGREAVDVAVAVEQVDGFVANVAGNQVAEEEGVG